MNKESNNSITLIVSWSNKTNTSFYPIRFSCYGWTIIELWYQFSPPHYALMWFMLNLAFTLTRFEG